MLIPKVLVVDDEPRLAAALKAYLEDEGMGVTSAHSGEEALALVRSGAWFDVCIMDMRLSGMDGVAAIRALHRLNPQLDFLIHTGTAGFQIPEDLKALGLSEQRLFKKPLIDLAPLAGAVRTLGACQ